MPKSRSKRRKKKVGSPKRAAVGNAPRRTKQSTSVTHGHPALHKTNGTHVIPPPPDTPALQICDDISKGKYRIVLLSPLMIGVFAVMGFQAARFQFLLIVITVACFAFARLINFIANTHLVVAAAIGGYRLWLWRGAIVALGLIEGAILSCFFNLTHDLSASVILLCSTVLFLLLERFVVVSARQALLFAIAVLTQSWLLSMLGVFSQYSTGGIQFQFGIFGLASGSMLAAGAIAFQAKRFESIGWLRSYQKVRADGKSELRPGRVTVIYTIFLILIPAAIAMLTPLGVIPRRFIAFAIPIAFTPQHANAFLEQRYPDEAVLYATTRLGVMSAVIAFLLALTFRY